MIFERADGLYDVENVIALGKIETVNRPPLKSLKEARDIALGDKPFDALVWVRHHATPNAIELYRS